MKKTPKKQAPDTRSLSEIKGAAKNPRKITDARLSVLRRQLAEFGDLGGIVFNVETQELVSGHQRMKEFDRAKAQIQIVRKFEPATASGTVAEGVIMLGDERFSYREVRWPKAKATAALLAANNHAGEWEDQVLRSLLQEMQNSERGFDLSLTGFEDHSLADLLSSGGHDPKAEARATLAERFIVPPFSVLDARQGYWQDRKRAWLALGIKSEIGRGSQSGTSARAADGDIPTYRQIGNNQPGGNEDNSKAQDKLAPGGSARPAMNYQNRERGDGAGRPIK